MADEVQLTISSSSHENLFRRSCTISPDLVCSKSDKQLSRRWMREYATWTSAKSITKISPGNWAEWWISFAAAVIALWTTYMTTKIIRLLFWWYKYIPFLLLHTRDSTKYNYYSILHTDTFYIHTTATIGARFSIYRGRNKGMIIKEWTMSSVRPSNSGDARR